MPRVWLTAPAERPSSPLTVPTYVEGNDEAVHPDVFDMGQGQAWNGYRYWMVFTPFPNTDEQFENPSIVASNDGDTWVVPAGVSNPLADVPAGGGYNSDPDLVILDDTCYLFWRAYHNTQPNERIKVITSTDAVNWSSATELFTSSAAVRRIASPTVWFDGTTWHMWAVSILESPNVVMHSTATDPLGPWSEPATVTGPTVTGRDVWHIDVVERDSVLHMVVNDTTTDANSFGSIRVARSTDNGQTWTLRESTWAVIPTTTGRWDNNLYRSSGAFRDDGSLDLWYSAHGSLGWRIARTLVPNGLFR